MFRGKADFGMKSVQAQILFFLAIYTINAFVSVSICLYINATTCPRCCAITTVSISDWNTVSIYVSNMPTTSTFLCLAFIVLSIVAWSKGTLFSPCCVFALSCLYFLVSTYVDMYILSHLYCHVMYSTPHYLPTCLSTQLSFYLSTCLSIYPSIHLSVHHIIVHDYTFVLISV